MNTLTTHFGTIHSSTHHHVKGQVSTLPPVACDRLGGRRTLFKELANIWKFWLEISERRDVFLLVTTLVHHR